MTAIFGKHLTDAEIEAMKVLAARAGESLADIEVVDGADAAKPDADDGVVLFLGTPSTCAAPDLEDALAAVARGAGRAIWVWPLGAAAIDLPPSAGKYAYSSVPWHAEKLRAVIADDDVTCFETSEGTPIPKVQTERNLCVEEE